MKIHSEQKLKLLHEMRKKGASINEIVVALNMPKSTVWHHVQNIRIGEKYTKLLLSKQSSSRSRALAEWEVSKIKAKKIVGNVSQRDRFIISACLYWAEGSKKEFCFVNTDANLVRVFVECLGEFGISTNSLHVSIRLYDDLDVLAARKFWSGITKVPLNEIKSIHILKGNKHGKLQYGMCRIRVRKGKDFFKLINSIREVITEKV